MAMRPLMATRCLRASVSPRLVLPARCYSAPARRPPRKPTSAPTRQAYIGKLAAASELADDEPLKGGFFEFWDIHDPAAPADVRETARTFWKKVTPRHMDPVVRTKLLRQMRNLDWPPHEPDWQSGSEEDDLELYNWVDEAYPQALYQMGLYTPPDWTEEDAKEEIESQKELHELLKEGYHGEWLQSWRDDYGGAIIDEVHRRSPDFSTPPALIWESRDSGRIEWMAHYTADCAFAYLFECDFTPVNEGPRKFWERQARLFARRMGGTAHGLRGGPMLPYDEAAEVAAAEQAEQDFAAGKLDLAFSEKENAILREVGPDNPPADYVGNKLQFWGDKSE